MNYDLKDLKLLLQVAEHGSLRKAAEKSDLSVASASARIAKLESALGIALFTRQAKGLQLTRAGKIALHNVQKVFFLLREMNQEALKYHCSVGQQGPSTSTSHGGDAGN